MEDKREEWDADLRKIMLYEVDTVSESSMETDNSLNVPGRVLTHFSSSFSISDREDIADLSSLMMSARFRSIKGGADGARRS